MTAVASSLTRPQQSLLQQLLISGVSREELASILQAGSDQEWAEFQQRQDLVEEDTKICVGYHVILSGGTGRKRKFNGSLARVTEYPKRGAWMTVDLVLNDVEQTDPHQVKWRKGGFRSTTRRSLLLELGDDLLTRIFGFLGGPITIVTTTSSTNDNDAEEEYDPASTTTTQNLLSLEDAGKLHTQIAFVCQYLRQFCIRNLNNVLGLVDANLFAIREKHTISTIKWLCKYRCKLGVLKVKADRPDIPLLCKLLCECDTTALWKLEGCLFNIHMENTSSFITLGWSETTGQHGLVLDLSGPGGGPPSLERMALDLGIPFQRHACPKQWHDAIAAECPNLKHLKINCAIPCIAATQSWKQVHYSQSLFSIPSIETLNISFARPSQGNMSSRSFNGNFIRAYIQNLPNLTRLAIGFGRLHDYRPMHVRFHIDSETLRFLDVRELDKDIWVSCKCPRLELFQCMGHGFGNGTWPDWTPEQALAYQGGDVMYAGTTPMIGLEVPDTCKCILHSFVMIWSDFADSVRNARYNTALEDGNEEDSDEDSDNSS